MERLARKCVAIAWMALLIVTLLIVAFAPENPAYGDDENISVSCYKGSPEDSVNVGNVMVFTQENAGQSCNALFFVCRGRCFGCFSDFDLSEDVCYDNAGRRFLR